MTSAGEVTLLVEGGGTRTWAAAVRAGCLFEARSLSTHPNTTGSDTVGSRLTSLFRSVLDGANVGATDVSAVVAAHGAAATQRRSDRFAELLGSVLTQLRIRAQFVVTNDMVPVMLSTSARNVVAAIVGTGTGYAARRDLDRWTRVGGEDYLLSDEGGGFDLGMAGLRAAVRAIDGRGPRTALVERAQAWAECPVLECLVDALFERVYVTHPRVNVASFARVVAEAASANDGVALRLVEEAVEEVVLGIRTAAAQVGIEDAAPTLVLSGGLVAARSPLRDQLMVRINATLAPADCVDYAPERLVDLSSYLVGMLKHSEVVDALRQAFPLSVGVAGYD